MKHLFPSHAHSALSRNGGQGIPHLQQSHRAALPITVWGMGEDRVSPRGPEEHRPTCSVWEGRAIPPNVFSWCKTKIQMEIIGYDTLQEGGPEDVSFIGLTQPCAGAQGMRSGVHSRGRTHCPLQSKRKNPPPSAHGVTVFPPT